MLEGQNRTRPNAKTERCSTVRSRSGRGDARFRERASTIHSRTPPDARERLLKQALASGKVAQRVHWLRRQADLVFDATKGLVACKPGCSHCCNISVLVAEPEAKEIGSAIGRNLAGVPADRYMVSAANLADERGGVLLSAGRLTNLGAISRAE